MMAAIKAIRGAKSPACLVGDSALINDKGDQNRYNKDVSKIKGIRKGNRFHTLGKSGAGGRRMRGSFLVGKSYPMAVGDIGTKL